MKPSYRSRFLNPFLSSVLLTAATLAPSIVDTAQAATYTWDGTNLENWGTAHWTGAGSSWVDSSSNDAIINGGTVYAGSNGGSSPRPGSITASSITVSNATLRPTSDNVFWNRVGTITLNAGGILNGGWNATNHLTAAIVLNGGEIAGSDNAGYAATYGVYNFDNTIHVTADSTISVTGGGATLGQAGGTQFNVDSGKTLSVTGLLVYKSTTPNTGLIKNGFGTMTLSGANTYTGTTTVSAGTLQVGSGGTSGTLGTGDVTNNASLVFDRSDALTVANKISGTGTLTKTGAGTLVLSAANSYTGVTTISSGTLQVGNGTDAGSIASTSSITNNGALVYNVGAGNRSYTGVISGSGSLTQNSAGGTLTLTKNQTYTGETVVNQGVLKLDIPGIPTIGGLYDSSGITINNGGQILVSQWNALHGSQSTDVGTVTINAGGSMTTSDNVTSHIRGALVLNGGTLASGTPQSSYGSWYLNGDVTATGTTASTMNATRVNWSGTRTFTVSDAAGNLNVTGYFDGTGTLTKAGAGTMTLSGANTYTGTTKVNAGTLKLDFSATGAPPANIINTTSNSSALSISGGKMHVVGKDGATNSQRFNGVTTSGAGQIDFTSGASSGTLNASLGAITRSGMGTLDIVLPATGAISATVPGNNNGVVVDASSNWANFITVNNGASWASVSGGNIVPFTSYVAANTFGSGGSAYTYHTDITSNTITGAATTGDIRFNVDNTTLTLSGALDVSAGGILVTQNAATTGVTITGSTLYGNGGGKKLVVFNYGKLNIASQITDTANGVVFTGPGTTTLSNANNTYTGATTVSQGTLIVSGSIASSDVTVNGGILASGSTGTVGKTVTVNSGATLAAGGVGAVGAASVASDLNFSSGSIFDWDLTTGAGNGTYDTVSVTGALNITSGAKFNVVSSTGFSDPFWNATHTWTGIFGGKEINNFLVTNFLYSGSATAPTAEGSFTVSGSSLIWNAVPEPTSTLAGFLLAAGLLRRRR